MTKHLRSPLLNRLSFTPRAVIELSADALQSNFRAIHALVPESSVLPMIKADAYGHGMEWAGSLLSGLPGLYGLGVATLEEGATLRASLGVRGRKTRILVFSGTAYWSDEKGQYCERHGLTPVIVGDADWKAFVAGGWPERISYEIKFNTGMNRLGLSPNSARQVIQSLRALPPEAKPQGICTHLAMSEAPDSRLTRTQVERFAAIKSELADAFPAAHFHLSNSGAIWNHKQLSLKGLSDVIRPGLSLYGVVPWAGAPARGLTSVLSLKATVAAVNLLRPGESIGYGATYKVPGKSKSAVRVAVLTAGYADGIRRVLSNQGEGWLNGKSTRFLGIVSMDLSAVEASASTRVGDQVEILGPHIDIWAQARLAGTIPYELLTSMPSRVQRTYV